MRRSIKIYILISIIAAASLLKASGQSTSSPYSIFGLGVLEENSIGESKAMGGTGIAFLSERHINYQNPASYSGLDSLLSIFEIGVFGKYTSFASNSQKTQSLVNANLKYVVMGFRLAPWLGSSFGFTPYSSVGYNINSDYTIEGTDQTLKKTYSGEGGVNQAFVGASVRLVKNLSAGVNAAYLFGNVTHSESSDVLVYSLNDVTYLSNLKLNYGLNYNFNIKKTNIALGLIYGSPKKLKTKNETTVKTGNSTTVDNSRIYKYEIPANYGIGLAVSKDYFKAGIDFETSIWKGIDFNNPGIKARNSNRYSAGVEFPSQGFNKGTGRMIFYRFGAEYMGSYFVIKGVPIDSYKLTMGAGIPLKGVISVVNLSLEAGTNGTKQSGLFRENFVTLHLDLAFRAAWFMKKRYN